MKKGTHTKRVLLSFVGTNDAGKLKSPTDGAILTLFKKRKFDEVHLLWNPSQVQNVNFEQIAKYVQNEIVSRGYCKEVKLHKFDCSNVTDHNEIYPKLLAFCKSLPQVSGHKFTAAIASGTPAMQVCWILMGESGDFPLELVRSNEPKYGRPLVAEIRLGTGLPRIMRLEQEKNSLLKQRDEILPSLVLKISSAKLTIGTTNLDLSPIEFSYYRYFLERAKQGLERERFSGIDVSGDFLKSIVRFHKESFPESELFRIELEKMLKEGRSLSIGTFRANITKANKKIEKALANASLSKVFCITREGKRHAIAYGIPAPQEKIRITR